MEEKNNNDESKKVIKIVVIVLATIVILRILIILIIGVAGMIMVPTIVSRLYTPNYVLHGLKIYIPTTWQKSGRYQISQTGNCRIVGGTTNYSQETIEMDLIGKTLEHEDRIINGIDISYGFTETTTEKIYSYYLEEANYKYAVIFRNKIDSDEECNLYVQRLENSFTLESEDNI